MALSGNTSAGKSRLITIVAEASTQLGFPTVGISERAFHHRYLRLMFSDPARYAFPIQLSFRLERHLVLLRNLELGRVVIIERSHLDDEMFVREHRDAGDVSDAQYAAYRELGAVLHERIPLPDALVLMNPEPEVSIERLAVAERRGDRPREFPSDAARDGWVHRWHSYYTELHADYRARAASDPAFAGVRLIEADAHADSDALAATILELIRSRRAT